LSKQASELNLETEQVEKIQSKMIKIEEKHDEIYQLYKELLDDGLAKEIARFYLPVSTYTEIYVQFDLNNLLKFFQLRCAEDAQYEIRTYAYAMKDLASQFFPISLNIYEQYKEGVYLGEYEKRMIRERKIPDEIKSKTLRSAMEKLAKDLGIELI